jgi:MerR family transcriptional regulator, light-induced transcriptional regulator
MKPVPLRLRENLERLRLGVKRVGEEERPQRPMGLSWTGGLEEGERMPVEAPGGPPTKSGQRRVVDCRVEAPGRGEATAGGSAWGSAEAEHSGAKHRLLALADALHGDIIPRLVRAHVGTSLTPAKVSEGEVESFIGLLLQAGDGRVDEFVRVTHERGLSVTNIYLDLFAPAAQRLGVLWEQDLCDFASVTVALGRLQRLLRHWTQAFGGDVRPPPNGRRVLLAQHPQEQHSFGLSMVAEFFRRDGWEVLGGVGGAVLDPSKQVALDWFDVVGFSIGSEGHVAWAKERVADVRATSRNRAVVVLAGGPLLAVHPEWTARIGADAAVTDGGQAPLIGERLIAIGSSNA